MVYKKMSSHGSVSIPVQIRRSLGLQPRDVMEMEEKDGTVIIRPRELHCIFCGTDEGVVKLKGRGICTGCAGAAQELIEKGEE